MAFVYWIHLPEHTDISKEGYVGFTSRTVDQRFAHHKQSMTEAKLSHYVLYRAMKKYGKRLIVTTLVEGSQEYCLEVEGRLRPLPSMGWNMSCGGVAARLGCSHSEDTRAKISKAQIGKTLTEDHRAAISNGHLGKVHSEATKLKQSIAAKKRAKREKDEGSQKWIRPTANKNVWEQAIFLYDVFRKNDNCGCARLSEISGLFDKVKLRGMHSDFKAGWSPSDDPLYMRWLSTRNKEKHE